jgi:hypothetical protein
MPTKRTGNLFGGYLNELTGKGFGLSRSSFSPVIMEKIVKIDVA